MVRIYFEPYTSPAEGQKLPLPVRVYSLLWQAVNNNPQWAAKGDRRQLKAAAQVMEAFDEGLSEQVLDGDQKPVPNTHRLKLAGAEVRLEDAAFDSLKDAWKSFAEQIPNALAREIIAVDEFLENAERIKLITPIVAP